ncbi:MAG TPA: hypothetical protein VNK91_13745 [Burkholderiaceae bacterium]|jgi:hypothetical protein|nr:hypothetical protein [Burkholderiaceae bacterium]
MELDVCFGADLPAYATVQIDVEDGATREQIVEKIKAFANSEQFNEVGFDVEWAWMDSLRIVDARCGELHLVEDVPLQPSPYDAGQLLQKFLNGHISLDALVKSAGAVLLLDCTAKESWRRTLQLPGAEPVEVSFTCRAGATREERDVAFVRALAAVARIVEAEPERESQAAEAAAEVAK